MTNEGRTPVRRADARGPRPLRPRHPAAVRPRRHRPRLAAPCDVPGEVRRPRALRDRPDERAGQRPVRPGRARPLVPQHGDADGHAAHRAAAADPARRRLDRLRRQPAARVRDRQCRGRHRARVPPRRRPAPGPLAELGAFRRADGAPRGAAVAVARHALRRQPARRPTRARASPPRSRPRSPPPPRSRSTWASAASPSGWSPRPATTSARPGTRATPSSTPGPCSRRWPSSSR